MGRLALKVRTRNGKITKVGLPTTRSAAPRRAPRDSCSSSAPGEMEMTVRHGKNKSLEESLGGTRAPRCGPATPMPSSEKRHVATFELHEAVTEGTTPG